MSSQCFPTYSTARNKIVDLKLNLIDYVTQKEFKNLTGNVDTSDFALKSNVAEIKSKIDEIEFDKISSIDILEGKNLIEQNYVVYVSMNKYLSKASNDEDILSWKSMGVSNDAFKTLYSNFAPQLKHPYSHMKVYFKRNCFVNK